MAYSLQEDAIALGVALQTYKLCSESVLLRIFRLFATENFTNRESFITRLNELALLKQRLSQSIFADGEKLIVEHEKHSIKILSIFSVEYPSSLRMISRPPALLYIRGDVSIFESLPGIAVVGSREVSTSGSEITRRIVQKLVDEKYCIVSGLAIGVDSAAHRATLSAQGKTVAVLAHGLEHAKPKQNSRLGEEILESGGAWVSEFPIGRPPQKQSFVQRNRIQVGLSAGSIIIEAALNSGSITQADFCNQENRPLFCVVPDSNDNRLGLNCEGTQELVKQRRAYPLRTKLDYSQLMEQMNKSKNEIVLRADHENSTLSMF